MAKGSKLADKGSSTRNENKVYPHVLTKRERLKREAADRVPALSENGVLDLMTEAQLRRVRK